MMALVGVAGIAATAGGAIYIQENDDGTISFTDQATVAHAQGWEVFIGEKYLLPPQQVRRAA